MATQKIKVDQINPESAADGTVAKVTGGVVGWGFPGASVALDAVVLTSTDYTAGAGEFVVVDATSGTRAITLPGTGTSTGAVITVKKADPGPNYVVVTVAGGLLIDGQVDATIVSQWTSVSFTWTSTGYVIKTTARDDPASLAYTGAYVRDRLYLPSTGVLSIDEFNNDSLDPAWVRVDNPTGGLGRCVWTEGADVVSAKNEGGDAAAELHALMRPLTGAGGTMAVGDAFITCVTLYGPYATNYTMGGIVLADGVTYGAGNQIITLNYLHTGGQSNDVRAFTLYNTQGVTGGPLTTTWSITTYIRLVMTAANTWRGDYSGDGVSWILGTATVAKTITPTHVGIHCTSWGSAVKGISTYQFLRRAAGVS